MVSARPTLRCRSRSSAGFSRPQQEFLANAAAGIVVLLGCMLLLNGLAILLRHASAGAGALMALAETEEGSSMPKFSVRELNAWFGDKRVLHGINLGIARHETTAVIGPSGCGKSTFIRCLNRMHELVPTARVDGQVWLDGVDVYERRIDPVLLRRRVGMVFQKPIRFPRCPCVTTCWRACDLPGRCRAARGDGEEQIVERALSQAALWAEVKDRWMTRAWACRRATATLVHRARARGEPGRAIDG
jgi:ABC-type uncharacterized transport system YnjBCD ATPase subunit